MTVQMARPTTAPCLLDAWAENEHRLYLWLYRQSQDAELAVDLLQETFLKALQMDRSFCQIEHPQAWLFRVAGNLLKDEWRKRHIHRHVSLESEHELIASQDEFIPAVDSLVQCLPKALNCLSADDREVIEQCDLFGCTQQHFAALHNLSLTAVKSRIQRARRRLSEHLKHNCRIRFDDQQRICCFSPSDNSHSSEQ